MNGKYRSIVIDYEDDLQQASATPRTPDQQLVVTDTNKLRTDAPDTLASQHNRWMVEARRGALGDGDQASFGREYLDAWLG